MPILKKVLERSPALKTLCRELFHRTRWYDDDTRDLERLFQWSEDPWNFQSSQYERDRMGFLLERISRYPHERILEIGCAEGVFTAELAKIAREVVAIDVSATALSRARRRCPGVTFHHARLSEFVAQRKFDLVVCAETLYYIRDVGAAINQLSALGTYCMVSYLHRETRTLDPFFLQMSLAEYSRFEKSYAMLNRAMSVAVWKDHDPALFVGARD